MTDITPSLRKPIPPSLLTLLETFRHDLLKNLNCVKVGVVESYSAGGVNQIPIANVRIAQQQVTSVDSTTGVRTLAEYPILVAVPVAFMGGGGLTHTFPIASGDECIILFNDRELANWVSARPGQPPNIDNLHDLSDGLCLVGVRSDPRALANISTTSSQLRTDDGTAFIEVGQDGHVAMISPTTVTITSPLTTVNGDLMVTGAIDSVGDILGQGVNLKTHVHINGGGTGNSATSMIFRNLDVNGDWKFGQGKGNYLSGNAAIMLNIKTRLYSWVNDCFFDLKNGVDWTNRLSLKDQKRILDAELRRIILQSYGVTSINTFTSNLIGRTYTANFDIATIFSASYIDSIKQGV